MYIVKIPGINGLGKTQGCEKAGNEILKTLKEIHSNEKGIPINVELLDLEEIHVDNFNLEEANHLIYKNSLKMFETQPKTIFLGGDHSISYSTTKAFFDYCKVVNKESCLIVFDAHADCMEPMEEPTHEEWLRKLIEQGFPAENILLVGVRNLWKDEIQFIKEKGVRIISMNQLMTDLEDTCDTIMEFSNPQNSSQVRNFGARKSGDIKDFLRNKELYVSIDIDVVDPVFAPATGYIEPGGLTSRQFIYLIQRMNKIKNLKAIDIVEINPEKDKNGLTVKLGAKILGELL